MFIDTKNILKKILHNVNYIYLLKQFLTNGMRIKIYWIEKVWRSNAMINAVSCYNITDNIFKRELYLKEDL